MTIKTENWLGEYTSTIGTGDITLGGAIDGFAGFSNVGENVDVYYTVMDALDKETGIGTLTGGKLVRKDIHATLVDGAYVKNGSAINLSGDAQVYGTANAHFLDYVQAVANAEIVNTQAIAELKALQINGHALTASFNLTAADVGAHPDSWMPSTEALNVYQKDASDIRYLKTQDAEQVAGLVMRVGGAREQQLQQSINDVSTALIGGLPKIKYYDGVEELKVATNMAIGDEVCSGRINWDVKNINTIGKCLPLQNGLFAYPKNAINILDFGADNTGLLLVNNALNDAADCGPVYSPPGRYRVEGFERRIHPLNNNIGQEQLVVYGDLSPYTLQHQYMVTPAIFEGDGDLFKKVVNYAFANIGVRNRSSLPTTYPDVPGTLFSMYGNGLEAGVFIGCYFGAANRHFSQVATGGAPTTADDYMIGPNYDSCSFFHAIEYSRYFDGVVANYSETGKCYTSHSKRGLYMKSPGPCVGLTQSVYEYIDDEAITVDAYGFVANYSVTLDRVFIESCGGDLAVIAGQTKPEKAKAVPSVKIATIEAGSVKVLFEHSNCFATYTGAHPPVAHFSIPAGNGTTTVQMVESGFLNGVVGTKMYTADANVYEDPFTTNNSLHQIKDGVETVKGLVVGGGQRVPNALLDVKSTIGTVAWLESEATSIRQVLLAQGIAADFGVDANGFFFSQLAGSKDLRIQNGDAYLDKSGRGLVLRSPNGSVTKRITISDAGVIVVS